ncbi:unnamed protein product [Rotaria magnacalcarata]|uniref:Uncharacterized protein n=1 Tax=Rotaria magnacalcarata TaxID=392030 RepID=A0A819HU94_9BILA|nr:unnamed protein product [Rotaria magnacalcarata]CAF4175764.1 unnamed protein product [Rotaria magnacalcarata]CAF4414971.1 unnamed protein product [Rotaria magnacalcarata]CAF4550642.1 unnamed protein product [Rotaria magnacalcarata]CAF4851023.1 unnamed protein product [Rotaria magnacalcarata]
MAHLHPIWLIASVEEGGLMGITQQLEQCHSLGMNMNYPSYMNNSIGAQSSSLYSTQYIEPSSHSNMASGGGWINYPLAYARTTANVHQSPVDPSPSSNGRMDDSSFDAY